MKLLFPDATQRSPTAVAGKSDLTDQNVYSAVVLQHGGAGTTQLFTTPRGTAIPALAGSAITAPTSAHQMKYTELTTSITQAGQFGSALGEGSVRGIGIDIENAYSVTGASGATATASLNGYGAGQQEVNEIIGKCWFRFSVGGKKQMESAVRHLPAAGGLYGAVSTTANAAIASSYSNGMPGSWRNLKVPILIARDDQVLGDFGIAGGDSLTFSLTTGVGQPVLVWVTLKTALKGDAR